MEKQSKFNERKHTDISLVAYLLCEGLKMVRIDRGKDKSSFYFEENEDLEKATLDYFNHNGKVDPVRFSETLRTLRSYAKQGQQDSFKIL